MRRARLPITALKPWAAIHGVELGGVTVMDLENGQGSGIVAMQDAKDAGTVFVRVPQELVLSKNLVWEYARADVHLRQVLEAMDEWAKTSQGAIVLFLLVQVTASSPDVTARIGVPNPFREYVQFLPDEKSLPSRWTDQELKCLWGTSLRNHMAMKQHSLQTIFDDLKAKTQRIDWCSKWWWDEEEGALTFDDFKQVDSMFRSRAMDFGEQGHSLVPVMDMANHDHDDHSIALYEIDRSNGGALLILEAGRSVRCGYEVTINYGSDRSASDLLHAYGFIEDMPHAGSMFVSFPTGFPPFENDPLAEAKYVGFELVPGVKFYILPDDRVRFHSPFVYAMSVNEEDGLGWDIARTVEGETEFHFLFRGKPVKDVKELVLELQESPLWELFQWRAHAYLLMLVEGLTEDIDALEARNALDKVPEGISTDSEVWKVCVKLRGLERKLLQMVKNDFEERLRYLQNSETVQRWSEGELNADGVLLANGKEGKEEEEEDEEERMAAYECPDDDTGVTDAAEYQRTEEQAEAEKVVTWTTAPAGERVTDVLDALSLGDHAGPDQGIDATTKSDLTSLSGLSQQPPSRDNASSVNTQSASSPSLIPMKSSAHPDRLSYAKDGSLVTPVSTAMPKPISNTTSLPDETTEPHYLGRMRFTPEHRHAMEPARFRADPQDVAAGAKAVYDHLAGEGKANEGSRSQQAEEQGKPHVERDTEEEDFS